MGEVITLGKVSSALPLPPPPQHEGQCSKAKGPPPNLGTEEEVLWPKVTVAPATHK